MFDSKLNRIRIDQSSLFKNFPIWIYLFTAIFSRQMGQTTLITGINSDRFQSINWTKIIDKSIQNYARCRSLTNYKILYSDLFQNPIVIHSVYI